MLLKVQLDMEKIKIFICDIYNIWKFSCLYKKLIKFETQLKYDRSIPVSTARYIFLPNAECGSFFTFSLPFIRCKFSSGILRSNSTRSFLLFLVRIYTRKFVIPFNYDQNFLNLFSTLIFIWHERLSHFYLKSFYNK